jgi:putative nucleotidyltransferase with HDIG domain
MRPLVKIRCERGAEIALRLGLPIVTAEAIRSLDEQWDGAGHPQGLRESAIPILSRIASLAQSADVFVAKFGLTDAMVMLQERRGKWFDPALTNEVLSWTGDAEWWGRLRETDNADVRSLEPASCVRMIDEASVDNVAQVFAEIADAKSPFMYGHSRNVATYAESMARAMGFDAAQVRLLRRAALLHDIGMLGVSSSIIDKVTPLAPLERFEIQAHPLHTFEILSGVSVFQDVAKLAATHHEKLDGSGYPWGLDADQLDPMSRTLVVADVFEAAMADRAFRRGLSRDEALSVVEHHRGLRLWGEAIDALAASVGTDEEIVEL